MSYCPHGTEVGGELDPPCFLCRVEELEAENKILRAKFLESESRLAKLIALPKELPEILKEVADILGNYRPMRYPIIDELQGFAGMLADVLKEPR